MNRLKEMRCYLCGAMEFSGDYGIGWRQDLRAFLDSFRIAWLDPTNKPIDIGIEGKDEITHIRKLLVSGEYEKASILMSVVRSVDLRLVDICDFMIVVIDTDIHHCGTYEELFWANRMKKPILIVVKQGKSKAPGWLFGTVPHQMIFNSFQDMYIYLERIASNSGEEDLGRWRFFKFQK